MKQQPKKKDVMKVLVLGQFPDYIQSSVLLKVSAMI